MVCTKKRAYWPFLSFLLSCLLTSIAGSVAHATEPAFGIDVSHYQGAIDWDVVSKQGVDFVYVKATEGTTYTDPKFKYNWSSLAKLPIAKGAYHYLRADQDPLAQAQHFIEVLDGLPKPDLPPAVDVEVLQGVTPRELKDHVQVWVEAVEAKYSVKPVIYIVTGFVKHFKIEGILAQYPLWYAKYDTEELQLPDVLDEFTWEIWQYGQGRIKGISTDVDFNRFNGGTKALAHFLNSGKTND